MRHETYKTHVKRTVTVDIEWSMILGERVKKNYARSYKMFFMPVYIFMFYLAPIIPYRADEIVLMLDGYVRQVKIDSILAYSTMKRIILNGTEKESEALFS